MHQQPENILPTCSKDAPLNLDTSTVRSELHFSNILDIAVTLSVHKFDKSKVWSFSQLRNILFVVRSDGE